MSDMRNFLRNILTIKLYLNDSKCRNIVHSIYYTQIYVSCTCNRLFICNTKIISVYSFLAYYILLISLPGKRCFTHKCITLPVKKNCELNTLIIFLLKEKNRLILLLTSFGVKSRCWKIRYFQRQSLKIKIQFITFEIGS